MKPTLRYGTFILGSLLASPLAIAYDGGDKTGGGGDRIQCLENGKLKNYMLDLFEAKERGFLPQLGDGNLSVDEKINQAEAFLSNLDPARAKTYANDARQILEDIRALEGGAKKGPHGLVSFSEYELDDIDDADEEFDFGASNEKPTPTRCIKSQLVRQDFDPSAIAPYRIFRKDYQSLDNDQKTAMLFHEVIYKEFRQHGALVSKTAREFTRTILTGQLSTAFPSVQEYLAFLRKNRIPTYVHFYGSFVDPTFVGQQTIPTSGDPRDCIYFKDGRITAHCGTARLAHLPQALTGHLRFLDGKLQGIRASDCFDLEDGRIVPNKERSGDRKSPTLNRYCGADYDLDPQNGTLTVKATNDLFISHSNLTPYDFLTPIPTHTFVTDLDGKILSSKSFLDSRPMNCQIHEDIRYLDIYVAGGTRIRGLIRAGVEALGERGYTVAKPQDADFIVEEFDLPDGSSKLVMHDIRRLKVYKVAGKKKRMESRKSFYQNLIRQLPVCPNR